MRDREREREETLAIGARKSEKLPKVNMSALESALDVLSRAATMVQGQLKLMKLIINFRI